MTPDNYTIKETFLEVGDGHALYVHEWGHANAKTPIIFLHGGPGGGCKDSHKSIFDPEQQRVFFFDQRGSGKSLPHGSIEHNTTAELIEDVEKIVQHFKLTQIILAGGSWGSCLALVYALRYPKRVKAMVLRGIFTGSQVEIGWLGNGDWRMFFPDVWERFLAATPKSHWHNPATYHYKRVLGDDEAGAKLSACAFDNMEGALVPLDDRFRPAKLDNLDPAGARIEMYYLANHCFLPDRYVMNSASKLSMPVWLVQGRYDFVCPPAAAYELHQKLPNSQLAWTIAGHSGYDRATCDVMRTALLSLSKPNPD